MIPASTQIPVYLAAGGQSSRFGAEKARAVVGHEVLIQRLARLLSPWATSITVVTAPSRSFDDLGLVSIHDLHPGIGPLAALHAALLHVANEAWILLASCDVVLIKPSWIATLLASRRPDARAVAFQHPGGALEPLLALYRTDLVAEIEDRISQKNYSVAALLRNLDAQGQAVLVPLPNDWKSWTHVNTPDELNTALREIEGEGCGAIPATRMPP